MLYSQTTATNKIASLTKRIRAIQGGTSASKTISILLILIAECQTDYDCIKCGKHGCQEASHSGSWVMKPKLVSIVSESMPHMRRGAMRDFQNIMQSHNYWNDNNWSATNFIYTFETGSKMEFFSADSPDKTRGPRRDRLFLNECNNIPYEAYNQLEVRTRETVWLDWNPTNEFWFYTEVLPHRPDDIDHITINYLDNEALEPAIIQSIESRKHNKSWWQVYGLGELGEVEGKVYRNWQIIDTIPHEARLERRGLDFGYSNDPSTIIDVYYYNGGYIFDEQLYRKGMQNKQLADFINNLEKPECLVVADSAEPKSIDELRAYGCSVIGAWKGKGSVNAGIDFVQNQQISITKRSVNMIKEYRNYLWMTDKEGRIMNVPEDQFNHCFAPESLIYTTQGKKTIESLVGQEGYLYSRGGQVRRFYDVKPTRTNAEIVHLTFDDGQTLSVTPNHLLLQPDGSWVEAGLLLPLDTIQSVTYETNYLQWKNLSPLSWRTLFQPRQQAVTSGSLGVLQWPHPKGLSHSSHRSQPIKQRYLKSRTQTQTQPPVRPYDSRASSKTKGLGRPDQTTHQEVAYVRRGTGVAQATWQEDLGESPTLSQRLRSLPRYLRNLRQKFKHSVLPPELQNESPTKKVARVSRGFAPITYNLEVEGTHCLLVDGVIAHNSMDAIRYAMESLRPQEEEESTVPAPDITSLIY